MIRGYIRRLQRAGVSVAFLLATPALAAVEIPATSATFTWDPASGPVAGYFVYVARNGAPEAMYSLVDAERETIPGEVGDELVVRVASFDGQGNTGPFSPPSDPVVFVADAPAGGDPPPGDDPTGGDPPSGNDPPSSEPPEDPQGLLLYFDDFETYQAGQDPEGWTDTGPYHSMQADPALFETLEMTDGNLAFGTLSESPDVHAHLTDGASETWSVYEYAGRMAFSQQTGEIGVTFYSDYPATDSYYRLSRSLDVPRFRLTERRMGGEVCVGSTDSGVSPAPGRWYHFRVQAFPSGIGTRMRARVWGEGDLEPTAWQIDCVDENHAYPAGRPGLWASGPGEKYWDDLSVALLSADALPVPGEPPAPLYDEDFESFVAGSHPADWLDTATQGAGASPAPVFEVMDVLSPAGEMTLGTGASVSDVHSHYTGAGSESWESYEVRGLMSFTGRRGAIGVTLYSDYPDSDSYYRLRSGDGVGGTFHLADHPVGSDTCVGTTDSGAYSNPKFWYRFRLQAFAEGAGTRIRAKVWHWIAREPRYWQIDCVDETQPYLSGRPGLWAAGRGKKYWDELAVIPVDPNAP